MLLLSTGTKPAEFAVMTERVVSVQERFDHHCAVCLTYLHTARIEPYWCGFANCEDWIPWYALQLFD